MGKIVRLIQSIHEQSVNSSFINKIYNMLNRKQELNDDTIDLTNSSIAGEITLSGPTYQEYVTYIRNTFSNLIVNCESYYILFADNNVRKRMIDIYGDGVGVIPSDVTHNTWHRIFISYDMQGAYGGDDNNTEPWAIQSFNELSQFTTIKTLESHNFYGQKLLQSINLANIKAMGDNNFTNCSSLTNLGDTSNLTSLTKAGNFNGCSSLTSINFPSLVGTIPDVTFQNCTSLETVSIPNVTTINANAFKNCTALTTVIGSNLTNLKAGAFEGCTSLTSIDFSNVVENIGAFMNCSSLGLNQDLDINLDGKSFGSNAFRNTGYKTITLHETTEHKITNFKGSGQSDAFGAHMSNLIKFDLSDTKQTGSTNALYANAMTTLIYPETQTSLILKGRDYGTALLYIICLSRNLNDIADPGGWTWYGMLSSCAIYVWDDIYDTYMQMTGWAAEEAAGRVKKISQLPSDITWYTKEHPSS